jgi:hypothetical protein
VLFGGSMMGIFGGIYYYYPKMTGRLLSEKLGNWHFWLMFIGMNITFFPMHFSGLYGMPRRTYTYDAGQGWEGFNLASSIGTVILFIGLLIFVYNFLVVGRRGAIAGNDPWGAGTLEWSIPSPPPEYNFARIPRVTSRLPLWDVKTAVLNAEVPHSERGDKRVDVDVGSKHAGHSHGGFVGNVPKQAAESRMHIEEATGKSAKDLGIPMPNRTIKPLLCAAGWVMHEIDKTDSQTHALVLTDINGDGVPDIVTGKRHWAHLAGDPGIDEPSVLCWYELQRQGGQVTWTRHDIDHDSGVGLHFQVLDINGDGLPDIVTSSKKGVYVFLQKRG